jgi:hypothetical protein
MPFGSLFIDRQSSRILISSSRMFLNFNTHLLMPCPEQKKSEKNQEVANLHGYLKKNSLSPVKNSIFGNATKITFLHKVLSRVAKLSVATTVCHFKNV